jgi:hypothetical protein
MKEAIVTDADFKTGLLELELTPETDQLWHNAWQAFQAGVK